jgi:hypothetical protein
MGSVHLRSSMDIAMNDTRQLARSFDISSKVSRLFQNRITLAQEQFGERMKSAFDASVAGLADKPQMPWDVWTDWYRYSTDLAQRSILFLDALRERGNNFVERNQQGLPPVLHFEYETVVDGPALEEFASHRKNRN